MRPSFPKVDQTLRDLRRARTDWRALHREADIGAHVLPSTTVVEHIVDRLCASLYPQRLGIFGSKGPEEDAYVDARLRDASDALLHQIGAELTYRAAQAFVQKAPDAATILANFIATLPAIRRLVDSDVEAAHAADPAAGSVDEILLCEPGPIAILRYRIAHQLYVLGAPLIARIITRATHGLTGIDIHPGAVIGPSFCIQHGTGTVIGATARIGAHVQLHQGVTLGGTRLQQALVPSSPPALGRILEDRVIVHAGATIVAGLTLGRASIIGANVTLSGSIGPECLVEQAHNVQFRPGPVEPMAPAPAQ